MAKSLVEHYLRVALEAADQRITADMDGELEMVASEIIEDAVRTFKKRAELEAALDHTPTLRDQFAMAALPAVYAEYMRGNGTCMGMEHAPRNIAAHAFTMADAMLEARKVKP